MEKMHCLHRPFSSSSNLKADHQLRFQQPFTRGFLILSGFLSVISSLWHLVFFH